MTNKIQNPNLKVLTIDESAINQLNDELLQLDVETFEIEELSDMDQHAAKSCTSTCSSCTSTTSCCQ